jgi:hypothetical protein
MLIAATNVNGRPNSHVVVPRLNGADIMRRTQGQFVIDFADMAEQEAAKFELPFEYVRPHVQPIRAKNRREGRRTRWWRHAELYRATQAIHSHATSRETSDLRMGGRPHLARL